MTNVKPITEGAIKETIFMVLGQIAPEADLDQLDLKANVREVLDIDSFDYLNVLIGLNEALGVEIPESDYGKLTTLEDMVRYLADRVR